MQKFKAIIEKFGSMGEKTGWTYLLIDSKIAAKINPGVKKSYRIKGNLDNVVIGKVAIIPIGEGDFILPLNADLRKKLKKQKGEIIHIEIEKDNSEIDLNQDFIACLKEEKRADAFFKTLSLSHQRYFSKWIETAKTSETKAKRIAQALEGLSNKMGFPEMMRYFKEKKLHH